MKKILSIMCLLIFAAQSNAQTVTTASSAIDSRQYGVVLDDPRTKKVSVKENIVYFKNDSATLHIDVYRPPGIVSGDRRPAVIFLNGVGDEPGEPPVKSWEIYRSWPRLMAANGYIGISMETSRADVDGSIIKLFDFISKKGPDYNIDAKKLGIYAASANVTRAVQYLMGNKASTGIKAAVLYYGSSPSGPFRKDLPVYYLVSETDVRGSNYDNIWKEVLVNKAPWTIKMASGMPHAFDAFQDNDEARIIIKETISFWQNHLDPVPQPAWKPSVGREILAHLYADHASGLPLLEKYTSEHPEDTRAMFTYGEVLARANQHAKAKDAFLKIVDREPANVSAIIQLAAVSLMMNSPADADNFVKEAIKTGKMSAHDYAQLGFALLVANKNDDAARYYEKALSMRPSAIDYYNLACAYAKNKHRDKALDALEKSITMGYGTRQHINTDGDLDFIRNEERFKRIVERVQ